MTSPIAGALERVEAALRLELLTADGRNPKTTIAPRFRGIYQQSAEILCADLRTLCTALREATRDVERLNYLAEAASRRGPVSSYNVESPPLVAAIAYDTIHTLREAIDAAMSTTRAAAQGEGSE